MLPLAVQVWQTELPVTHSYSNFHLFIQCTVLLYRAVHTLCCTVADPLDFLPPKYLMYYSSRQ